MGLRSGRIALAILVAAGCVLTVGFAQDGPGGFGLVHSDDPEIVVPPVTLEMDAGGPEVPRTAVVPEDIADLVFAARASGEPGKLPQAVPPQIGQPDGVRDPAAGGAFVPALPANSLSSPEGAAAGCTPDAIFRAFRPLDDLHRQEFGAEWETYRLDALMDARNVSPTMSLQVAATLDQVDGRGYWTARWVQNAAQSLPWQTEWLNTIYGNLGLQAEADAQAQGPSLTSLERLPHYRPVFDLRNRHLAAYAEAVRILRGSGCAAQADRVAAIAFLTLSFGAERKAFLARPLDDWAAFGLLRAGLPSDQPAWFYNGWKHEPSPDVVAEAERLFAPAPVASAVGPVPVGPSAGADADPAGVPEDPPGRERRPRGPDPGVAAWDRAAGIAPEPTEAAEDPDAAPPSDVAAAERPAAAAAGPVPDDPTWLAASGLGVLSQQDSEGFWTTGGFDETVTTLVRATPDGFDGRVVRDDGSVGGVWLEMHAAQPDGWRGKVLVSLREPKGACPHWVPGALLRDAQDDRLLGGWKGTRVEPEGCRETDEPDSGALELNRMVLARFLPLVPGKYIHLIGAPAAGASAAQYRAAAKLACGWPGGLPVARHIATADSGTLIPGESDCTYQLVVEVPGTYQITFEFLDGAGAVLHRQLLRVEFPAIPGIAP